MFGESDARREDPVAGGSPAPEDGVEERFQESPEDLGHGGAGEAPSRAVPTPPVTGDEAVDEAMMRMAEAQAGSFAERIEAGEHAHHSLQSRLGGLGGA